MAWFELHEQFANHPKIARLSRALNVPKVQTRGHIITLWCWVASYAQDGVLTGFDDSDIASAADWEGDPNQFVSALKSAGWLDPTGVVHDWDDHGMRLLRNMRERQKKSREKADRDERDADDPSRDAHASVINPHTLSRDSHTTVTALSRPTDHTDHTDPTDISDISEQLVVDAPRREMVKNAEQLKELDFVLRLHDSEFNAWILAVKGMIRDENQGRMRNPFTWVPQTGSFESDMRSLLYREKDEVKQRILWEAYNINRQKLNWPNYVQMAIRYTLRTSEKTRIAKPFGFTVMIMRKPGEIVSAKSDGILAGVAV